MKVIAVNGSARRDWNTYLLLEKALEGARSVGAEVELVQLSELDYKGCRSCFACKAKNGASLGRCACADGLKPVLDAIHEADGLIIGTPIYLSEISSLTRAFIERLIFQYSNFDERKTYYTGSLKAACIYTMNSPSEFYEELYKRYERMLGWDFGYVGTVASGETQQFDDYDSYHFASIDGEARKQRRREVFPLDCQRAFELGKAVAEAAAAERG